MAEPKNGSKIGNAIKNAIKGTAGAINRGLGSPIQKSGARAGRDTAYALKAEKNPSSKSADEWFEIFNNSEDPVQRRSYGKAYLLSKYGEDKENYLNNEIVEDSIVEEGVDDDNPFVAFLDTSKKYGSFESELSDFYINCIQEDSSVAYSGENALFDQAIFNVWKKITEGDETKTFFLNTIQALTTGLDRVNKHRDNPLKREDAEKEIGNIIKHGNEQGITREYLTDELTRIGPKSASFKRDRENTAIDTSNLKEEEKDQLIALLKKIKFNPKEHGISFE